jgi:hypothetical protein
VMRSDLRYCLEVDGGSLSNGARLVISSPCQRSTVQTFVFSPIDHTIRPQSLASMCLEGALQNGAFLYLKTCNSGINQQFNLLSSGTITMYAGAQFSVGIIASQYGHSGVDIVMQSAATPQQWTSLAGQLGNHTVNVHMLSITTVIHNELSSVCMLCSVYHFSCCWRVVGLVGVFRHLRPGYSDAHVHESSSQ